MPANHTPNYNLNQWEPEDRVLRTDFNADNTKIDAAIQAVDTKADRKADASALETLSQKVTAQGTTLTEHAVSITRLGNCRLYTTTYIGNGASSRSFSFPHRPVMVFVYGEFNALFAMYGVAGGHCQAAGDGATALVTWTGNSVRWEYNRGVDYICNASGDKYSLTALLDAEN